MTMHIVLSGGDRVEALTESGRIVTEQDGSAPAPFELFLASIGTCAGFYAARFCRQRDIATDAIRIRLDTFGSPDSEMVERVELEVELPPDFPERYRDALIRATGLCKVKKHLEHPPTLSVRAIRGRVR